jgi:glycosyltransferase involved in cell wall biosynthesis
LTASRDLDSAASTTAVDLTGAERHPNGRQLTVVHVITSLADGGAQGVLNRLISSDAADRHHVISLMDEGVHGPRLAAAGIPVDVLDMPRGRVTIAGLWKLHRILREVRPDVVQTWMYHADLVGGVVARLIGESAVVWGVRNAYLDPRSTSRTTRIVAQLCSWGSRLWPNRIVSCSSRAAELHIRRGYDGTKFVVIPNGYDPETLAPDPEARARTRREWSIGSSTMLLGMVARWDPQKDHRTLIGALASLRGLTAHDWRCVLVGTGMVDDNRELTDLVRGAGVGDRVALLGPRRNMSEVMNALDLHVLSSNAEAFPNVVAEAMACGTPCVVTDVGDAAQIVGETGWIVPPGDQVRLAAAIAAAIDEIGVSADRLRRQSVARRRIVDQFGLDRMVQSYRELWSALAARRKSQASA